ncbi:IniB N-terminal domain-containing protein [Agromyces bauzanensis]|uniref:Uncharacterized protein n=1 Tax=Agromyces bauzanensis TaxID=1308924 RepID=A0A917UQX5_9MICO|nr:IniB N-terminal domain-containing protein [Agromyces bauzanensis]GGJ78698.1 hypothetical protein GCM10011372_16240 [Agromyces bauzanensis]
MTNITTALLDFLMGLLKNPQAGADFVADPDTALHNAGLNGICAADVDAVLPVALDFSPVGNREYDTGGNSINVGGGGWGGGDGGGGWGGGDGGGWGGGDGGGWGGKDDHGDYAAAKAKLVSVVNTYSYIDDRDVINDQSVNQAIWANDSIVAVENDIENTSTTVGDGSMVATTGGTIVAGNTEYDLEVDIEDSFNEENELEIEDSFNDNSDNSTTNVTVIEDSFQDNSVEIEDSFQDNSTEVDIEDSFNETETEVEVDIEDSFNEDNSVDNSTNTDVDVEIEDSFQANDNVVDSFDDNVVVEDSFQANDNTVIEDNNVAVDSFDDNTVVEDNVVVEESFSDNNLETGPGDLTEVEVEVEDVTL